MIKKLGIGTAWDRDSRAQPWAGDSQNLILSAALSDAGQVWRSLGAREVQAGIGEFRFNQICGSTHQGGPGEIKVFYQEGGSPLLLLRPSLLLLAVIAASAVAALAWTTFLIKNFDF